MSDGDWVKAHYIDASALVKLVAEDEDETSGREVFRKYYFSHGLMRSSSFCVAECLSAFKLKFVRKKISASDYVRYIREFYRLVISRLQLEDLQFHAPEFQSEVERLIHQYGLDFVDAAQIVTLLKGKFAGLVGESQSILITADRRLADVARLEGARVWECTTEPSPSE
jgi:predicted nucleic acid-binding protein